MATLTYVYADQTAVLGPLATYAEPHCYDLCEQHTDRMTAPRGWEVVRLQPDPDALRPSSDDLEALADAVREAARPRVRETGRPWSRSAAAATCGCCATPSPRPDAAGSLTLRSREPLAALARTSWSSRSTGTW